MDRIEKKFPIKSIITIVICGYLTGAALTVAWYLFLTETTLNITKWTVWGLLVLFLLILCYSRGVRCTITLAIPILCSSKGRSLVIALAFILAATGPTVNIIRNVDVMTTSLSCGQTQLKEALGKMLDVMKRPLVAIKEAIGVAIAEVRRVVAKVQVVLLRIQELVLIILASIKNAFDWLGNIVSVCNKEFGTPFERCMRIADEAMEDCSAKLGPLRGLCRVTHLFSMLCYSVKFIDYICVLVVLFDDTVIQTVLEKLRQFKEEIKNLFDVTITFDHDFYFSTIASKDLAEVGADIMADVHAKTRTFFLVFGYLDVIGTILFFTVFLKALYFKAKYLRSPAYNNRYVTKDFIGIDEQRQRTKQEVALPLTGVERRKYVMVRSSFRQIIKLSIHPTLEIALVITDCRLTRQELMKIARSMLFLIISCIQLFCICFADYSLYWLLSLISYYGHQDAGLEVPPYITVDVKGGGFVGEIFQGIVHAFEPLSQNYTVDTRPCLPIPYRPNFNRYLEIGLLCLLAWVFLICQPYGLRLRHIVMRLYYPEVALERATWLYNEILMRRMSFFKFARRKARAMFSDTMTTDDFTFLDWLRAKTDRYWICRFIFGPRRGDYCIICSKPVSEDKVTCDTVGCKAVYCTNCYNESKNTCCICKNPIEYGDTSDISEVRDSSEEPLEVHVHESDKYCSSN